MKNQKDSQKLQIGKTVGLISNILSVLSWCGIPFSLVIGILQKSFLWVLPIVFFIVTLVLIRLCKIYNVQIIGWILGLFAPKLRYSFSSWDIYYEYKKRKEMEFRAFYTVKPLQTDVDHVRIRYNWSAETKENPIWPVAIVDPENQVFTSRLVEDGKEYGYNYYKVFSNSSYNKGDSDFKLGVRIDMKGADEPSPHLLTSIGVRTSKLHMQVSFPQEMQPKNVEFFEYLHATDDYHWHKYEGKAELKAQKWTITWDINRPIYGGKYLIRWMLD